MPSKQVPMCQAAYDDVFVGMRFRCVRGVGHRGMHEDKNGVRWEDMPELWNMFGTSGTSRLPTIEGKARRISTVSDEDVRISVKQPKELMQSVTTGDNSDGGDRSIRRHRH